MSIDSPRELLVRHHLRPKQSWGQNFLASPEALTRIARAAVLQAGEPVLELGAGLGHLTSALLAAGARVVAVERDRDLVAVLEKSQLPGVRVVAANAARLDFAQTYGEQPVVVVGNLPYHLTSSILFEVIEQRQSLIRAVFTLQKEVVTRLAASPGNRDYGLLTVLLGLWFEVERLFTLPASMFHPPPKVDSATVRLTPLPEPRGEVRSEQRFIQVVKASFAHRRKTLLNSLKSDAALGGPEVIAAALAEARVDPSCRAETLAPEQFAAIERALPA